MVSEGPPIPTGPGNSVYSHENYRRAKRSTLKYINGVPGIFDAPVPSSSAEQPALKGATSQKDRHAKEAGTCSQSLVSSQVTSQPGWLAFDRKVLRFFCYFKEPVVESAIETWRVRRCTLHFYLEDGSAEIVEPVEDNSGLPQGTQLRRHRMVLGDGSLLQVHHLRIGEALQLYGRSFVLVSCDDWTREFTAQQGLEQPPNEAYPRGPFEEYLEARRAVSPVPQDRLVPRKKPDQGWQQAMTMDRKVLRFWACWESVLEAGGVDRMPLILHYYLADDTIEVCEVHKRNDGRDPFPALLHRMKLPSGRRAAGAGIGLVPSARQHSALQYYKWQDLRVGSTVEVYGRKLLLLECDEFTKEWYRQRLGLPDDAFEPIHVDFDQRPRRPPTAVPQNSLGIGSEEDSLRNVDTLVPRPARRDEEKLERYAGVTLRFAATLIEAPGYPMVSVHDEDRKFVVTFFMEDDTIAIFEPEQPNSGMPGGRFLERRRVRKPDAAASGGQAPHSGAAPIYYEASDFYVGARLPFNSRMLLLTDADDHTLLLMEKNCHAFPMANAALVLQDLAAWAQAQQERLQDAILAADESGSGFLYKHQLYAVLAELGLEISMHQVIAICRLMDRDGLGVPVVEFTKALEAASDEPAVPAEG